MLRSTLIVLTLCGAALTPNLALARGGHGGHGFHASFHSSHFHHGFRGGAFGAFGYSGPYMTPIAAGVGVAG
jgi:hypothetical protein